MNVDKKLITCPIEVVEFVGALGFHLDDFMLLFTHIHAKWTNFDWRLASCIKIHACEVYILLLDTTLNGIHFAAHQNIQIAYWNLTKNKHSYKTMDGAPEPQNIECEILY